MPSGCRLCQGLVCAAVLLLATGCGPWAAGSRSGAPVLLVSAPASLSDVMGEVADAFERETDARILLNVAGSHLLATQMLEGAPVDVIISADVRQMDRVAAAGRIDAATRVDLLSNRLVAVVPTDREGSIGGPEDLARDSVRRIALGDPEAVPAGVYARRWLHAVGLWGPVADKLAPTGSVRAALRAVESGAVDAGIVYRTDALTSTAVAVAFEVPRKGTPPIVYPAALAADTPHPETGRRFLDYLRGEVAARLFEAAGFVLLARMSHQPSAAAADPLAVAGRTPSRRFDVVTTTPAASFSPCDPPQRRLDALATNAGEKCRLEPNAGERPS